MRRVPCLAPVLARPAGRRRHCRQQVRALSIGPSIKYDNGKGWFITAKLQRETSARNSTQGTAFWLKTLIPF